MHLHRLLAVSLLLAAPLTVTAQQPSPQLKLILEKLDAASANFHSAQADFQRELYNSLIKESDKQSGRVYFQREHTSTAFGMILLGANGRVDGPGGAIAEYKNGSVRDLNTTNKCFVTVQASADKIETFLTLGFGGSGRDLNKVWQITDEGAETVDGIKTEKLDLVPRDPGVKSNVTHVTLWLDVDRDVSVQQVFYTPSGDKTTAHYSNIRLNKPVDTKPFAINGSPCNK